MSEKTDNWTVTYGFVNGAAQGSGKTEMVSGTSRALIQAKDAAPDTLTVTNGFHGGVTFTKQDEAGTPVPGAVFQIIPNNAGADNYITGMDAMLTSGADGKVTITGLPIGTYWMWEKTAPEGHRKTDAMYCLQIGYPNSSMYLVAGSTWTAADKVVNPRVGEIVITKTVLVNGSAPAEGDTRADGTYQFNIDGVENTATANEHRAVEITFAEGKATKYQIDSGNVVPISTAEQTNSWSVTVWDLLLGDYIVSEAETDNGTVLINATGGVNVDNNKKVKVRVSAANGNTPQPTSESTEATPSEAPEAGDTANAENQAHAFFINALIKVDIRVIKIDEMTRDLTEVKLRDAEFTLTQWSETSAQYIEYKNGEESVKVTNEAGELSYSDLPNGKYRIEETGVPDGYIRTSDPYIYFTISNGTVTWTDEAGGSLTEKTNLVTYNAEDMTFTVGNYPGAKLPSTGGPGTTVFYIIGSLLTLFAAFLLLRRKEL